MINEVMTLTRDEIIALITHPDVTSSINSKNVLYLSSEKFFVAGPTGAIGAKPHPDVPPEAVSACRLSLQTTNSEMHANLVDKFTGYISTLEKQPVCECKWFDGTTFSYVPVVEKLSQTPPQEYTMRGDVKPEFAEELNRYETQRKQRSEHIEKTLKDLEENYGYITNDDEGWGVKGKADEKWFNTVPYIQRGTISMRFTENTELWNIVVEHLHLPD